MGGLRSDVRASASDGTKAGEMGMDHGLGEGLGLLAGCLSRVDSVNLARLAKIFQRSA